MKTKTGNFNLRGRSVDGGAQITGVIPTTVGMLTVLQEWNVANQDMTGTIPTEFGLTPLGKRYYDLALSSTQERTLILSLPSSIARSIP